ncbi:substrate-binding domain-containing protein [Sedimenticola sp.]|uniref:substrate-binding domain-containing protein n=1 Tax=Sedimenticola sp. TaxID=1940285 RepID=UPI0025839A24|nr:substrate-binding domain-containing protein [Sedimenticola sp.]MCW8904134.1 substrate-binding domain-containing protein [Sedimenticola sp.]
MYKKIRLLFSLCLLWSLAIAVQAAPLRMATTTSTQNSGLLDILLPAFQKQTGIEVHVIAVGTGKALKMGRDGDVDVVMVHAVAAEEKFVAEGFGTDRVQFMYNDFVIVGPNNDPAGIKGVKSVTEAMTKIQGSQSKFISRGDDSGTHKKEKALWKAANIQPDGSWYIEAGQGMGKVLQMASELDGYTLTDRGTWLAYKGKVDMSLLNEGDNQLSNPYGVIAVNPAKHPDTNYADAKKLIDWVSSQAGQELIRDYRLHGEPLFIPLLLK